MSAQIVRVTGLAALMGLLAAIAPCGCTSRQSQPVSVPPQQAGQTAFSTIEGHDKEGVGLPRDAKTRPVVHGSAAGWSLRAAPDGSTIVVNPKGSEFRVGSTRYPDRQPTTLWLVGVPALKREFLVLFTPPTASGAVPMTLFTIKQDGEAIVRAADILHHYEWDSEYTTVDEVRETLFVDSDGDGTPELVDDDVWKWGGTLTYSVLLEDRFQPRWRETFALDESSGKVVLTKRESVQK